MIPNNINFPTTLYHICKNTVITYMYKLYYLDSSILALCSGRSDMTQVWVLGIGYESIFYMKTRDFISQQHKFKIYKRPYDNLFVERSREVHGEVRLHYLDMTHRIMFISLIGRRQYSHYFLLPSSHPSFHTSFLECPSQFYTSPLSKSSRSL